MLTINATKQNAALELKLDGRLDTVTAPQLQETIQEQLDGVHDVVMDCADLSYVSSAGLRVLLTTRKAIQGELILRKVAPAVLEVLEITGFVDILTVES